MNAYRYYIALKNKLGELSPTELEEAMRMCGEGKTVEECTMLLQRKRERKASRIA